MAIPTKPNKGKNKTDAEYDMEIFKWKVNTKTVFVRKCNTKKEEKKLYLLFIDQCELSLKTKIKEGKGYDKAHKSQDVIKLLNVLRSVIFGVGAHLKGNWDRIKAKKLL